MRKLINFYPEQTNDITYTMQAKFNDQY